MYDQGVCDLPLHVGDDVIIRGGRLYIPKGITILRETEKEARNYLKKITGGNKTLLDRTLKHGLVGSITSVAQKIHRLEEVGIDHIILQLTSTLQALKNVKDLLNKI